MARITDEVSRGDRSTKPTEQLSLAQLRLELNKKVEDDLNRYRNDNIRKQADFEEKLRLAGLKKSNAEYKKQQKAFQNELLKNEKLQKLKMQNEIYDEQKRLMQENLQIEKDARTRVLNDTAESFSNKMKAASEEIFSKDNLSKSISAAVSSTLNQLDSIIDKYISFQKGVNARLQGSGRTFSSAETLLSTAVGIQPYVKTESMISKLSDLVNTGVAYNLEMRAFLGTVSENIATTFNIANASLLRIVRLQQEDSSAARLGVEASLTRYFNGMFQNTEYLSSTYDIVQGALLEASSLMNRNDAIEFEYQVQKWLGSLYSVGMSDSTVQGLATALGYLGSGNVSALSNSEYQNLLVMAASRSGLNYSDLLINGLDSATTNTLLASMTAYLKDIASGTNQVVKSELAQVFGVSVSDLTAALNLNTSEIKNISSKSMNYASSIAELAYQLQVLPTRMNSSLMIDNLWDNMMWSLGSGVAGNPMLSAIWKVTDLIQSTTGGINIPMTLAMGTGFDLNATVENLIKLGIVGTGSLGMIGDLVSGLASSAVPATMLAKLSLASELADITTLGGRGLATTTSGLSSSSTVYAGNSSGSDIASAATQTATDAAQADVDNSTSEKDVTEMTDLIQQDVARIAEMFSNIVGTVGIKVENFGLSMGGSESATM